RQLDVEAGAVVLGQASPAAQPPVAVEVPADALVRGQRVRPVAGAIAEQQFMQPLVTEAELALSERRWRRRADLGAQPAVGVAKEPVVQPAIDIPGDRAPARRKHAPDLDRKSGV